VCRADQLDTAFGNRAGGHRFEFAPDLVDHDDFGIVVFDGLDHDLVLAFGARDLHPARTTDRRVRHVAVAADLVGRIYDDHAARFRQHTGRFPQHGGLAHAGRPQQQDALARFDQVLDDLDGAVDRPPDAARQPHHFSPPVADGRDAVQRALMPARLSASNSPMFSNRFRMRVTGRRGNFGLYITSVGTVPGRARLRADCRCFH
jgi:hypothetical protein